MSKKKSTQPPSLNIVDLEKEIMMEKVRLLRATTRFVGVVTEFLDVILSPLAQEHLSGRANKVPNRQTRQKTD
jgi:hypothetical protein